MEKQVPPNNEGVNQQPPQTYPPAYNYNASPYYPSNNNYYGANSSGYDYSAYYSNYTNYNYNNYANYNTTPNNGYPQYPPYNTPYPTQTSAQPITNTVSNNTTSNGPSTTVPTNNYPTSYPPYNTQNTNTHPQGAQAGIASSVPTNTYPTSYPPYNTLYPNQNTNTQPQAGIAPSVPTNNYSTSYPPYNTPYPNQNTNTQQQTTSTDSSVTNPTQSQSLVDTHFWEDCEYINYEKGADSCSICEEEVEDDEELQKHLTAQHQVVFFGCPKCQTIYPSHETFTTHTCNPPPPPPPSPPPPDSPPRNNKRRRGGNYKRPPPPSSLSRKKNKIIPEKTVLNQHGALYVSAAKKAQRHKPALGTTQIQDLLQWQQSYTHPQEGGGSEGGGGGELVVVDENAPVALSRELLLQAKDAPDGIAVDIERMPDSAIVCVTCSLLFASSYQLNRHAGFSKVHKQHIDWQRREEQKAIRFDLTGDVKRTAVPINDPDTYRDRSAERRKENPGGCPLDYQPLEGVTDYIPADAPIEANNVGRKLLESMGWKEGKGLGKNEIGIVAPIMPQKAFGSAGLGVEVNKYDVAASEANSYADYTRNKKFARYAQMAKMIREPVLEPPAK